MERYGRELLGTRVSAGPGGGPGGRFPLLVKLIFSAGRLSVQVHPDDAYGLAHDGSAGKNELWHVLRAEPDASLALGFDRDYPKEAVREAALSGKIEKMLRWMRVAAGETYFIPAGTVHALGPGTVLCEIQQNSDLTYRLYDYGRGRPLHIEKALDVARLGPHPGRSQAVARGDDRELLAASDYFETERLRLDSARDYAPDPERFHLLVSTAGSGRIAGNQLKPGQCWLIPAAARGFRIEPATPVELIRTFVPAR